MPKWIKKYGFISLIKLTLVLLIKQAPKFIYHALLWPFPVTNMLYLIRNTHKNGLFKNTKNIKVKYLWRDEDLFAFQYLAAVFILFIVVIIINFSIH